MERVATFALCARSVVAYITPLTIIALAAFNVVVALAAFELHVVVACADRSLLAIGLHVCRTPVRPRRDPIWTLHKGPLPALTIATYGSALYKGRATGW